LQPFAIVIPNSKFHGSYSKAERQRAEPELIQASADDVSSEGHPEGDVYIIGGPSPVIIRTTRARRRRKRRRRRRWRRNRC